MRVSDLSVVRKRWVPAIGWAIFVVLIVALATGHYIFNPFIFGFSFYTIYVLSRIAVKEESANSDLMTRRIIALGLIALFNLYTVLNNGWDKHKFLRQFERTCDRYDVEGSPQSQVCREIRSSIQDSLDKEPDFGEE